MDIKQAEQTIRQTAKAHNKSYEEVCREIEKAFSASKAKIKIPCKGKKPTAAEIVSFISGRTEENLFQYN